MTERIIIMTLLLLFSTSCEWNQFADKIYYNGNIWTGNKNRPSAEFIAVKGETILGVGSNYKTFRGPETELIDLEGQFVVPGFIDNHTHFIEGGFQLMRLDLRAVDSKEEFISRIKKYVQDIPKGQWILGGKWDHEMWGGLLPTKDWIDSFTQDIPVFLSRLDGHMALANSKALELTKITKDTPDPPGGLIERDESGEPTGILRDEAIELIRDVIPDKTFEEMDAALNKSMGYAASLGLTQIHDMCSWDDFEVYVRNKDQLSLRIYAIPWYTHYKELIDYKNQHGIGDDWLRWHGIKAMLDGSLGSRTAWMHESYKDDPNTTGLVVSEDTLTLRHILRKADEAGLQMAVHAIGTRANEWVLDEFEAIEKEHGKRDRRSRIEHSQHLMPKDINRFSKNGITASMQPPHLYDDGSWAHKRVRDNVLKGTYVFRTLLESGANVTFGSDWPVASLDPLMGIYTAVTRHTRDGKNPDGWYPDEKISVEDAIRCYTINSAYAGFQEEKLGTIEAGKLADFVVLSKNITAIEPEEILNTKVVRTVVGGKDVFVKKEKNE
ncbi:MAG: amidohydrolase [Candidatus Marinimicrobia bacterium]|nr:amidohydrolase [Candidatus Neomarinimicrobiota bacterium]